MEEKPLNTESIPCTIFFLVLLKPSFNLLKKPPILGPATTLLILSDTKTIDQPRALAAVAEAKRRCGQTLILNPIPQSKWKYLRSVQSFASVAPMVPCSTLRELSEACRKLTR